MMVAEISHKSLAWGSFMLFNNKISFVIGLSLILM